MLCLKQLFKIPTGKPEELQLTMIIKDISEVIVIIFTDIDFSLKNSSKCFLLKPKSRQLSLKVLQAQILFWIMKI